MMIKMIEKMVASSHSVRMGVHSLVLLILVLGLAFGPALANNKGASQSKKCQQYGHSCLGGHGKRSSPPLLTPALAALLNQKYRALPVPLFLYRRPETDENEVIDSENQKTRFDRESEFDSSRNWEDASYPEADYSIFNKLSKFHRAPSGGERRYETM